MQKITRDLEALSLVQQVPLRVLGFKGIVRKYMERNTEDHMLYRAISDVLGRKGDRVVAQECVTELFRWVQRGELRVVEFVRDMVGLFVSPLDSGLALLVIRFVGEAVVSWFKQMEGYLKVSHPFCQILELCPVKIRELSHCVSSIVRRAGVFDKVKLAIALPFLKFVCFTEKLHCYTSVLFEIVKCELLDPFLREYVSLSPLVLSVPLILNLEKDPLQSINSFLADSKGPIPSLSVLPSALFNFIVSELIWDVVFNGNTLSSVADLITRIDFQCTSFEQCIGVLHALPPLLFALSLDPSNEHISTAIESIKCIAVPKVSEIHSISYPNLPFIAFHQSKLKVLCMSLSDSSSLHPIALLLKTVPFQHKLKVLAESTSFWFPYLLFVVDTLDDPLLCISILHHLPVLFPPSHQILESLLSQYLSMLLPLPLPLRTVLTAKTLKSLHGPAMTHRKAEKRVWTILQPLLKSASPLTTAESLCIIVPFKSDQVLKSFHIVLKLLSSNDENVQSKAIQVIGSLISQRKLDFWVTFSQIQQFLPKERLGSLIYHWTLSGLSESDLETLPQLICAILPLLTDNEGLVECIGKWFLEYPDHLESVYPQVREKMLQFHDHTVHFIPFIVSTLKRPQIASQRESSYWKVPYKHFLHSVSPMKKSAFGGAFVLLASNSVAQKHFSELIECIDAIPRSLHWILLPLWCAVIERLSSSTSFEILDKAKTSMDGITAERNLFLLEIYMKNSDQKFLTKRFDVLMGTALSGKGLTSYDLFSLSVIAKSLHCIPKVLDLIFSLTQSEERSTALSAASAVGMLLDESSVLKFMDRTKDKEILAILLLFAFKGKAIPAQYRNLFESTDVSSIPLQLMQNAQHSDDTVQLLSFYFGTHYTRPKVLDRVLFSADQSNPCLSLWLSGYIHQQIQNQCESADPLELWNISTFTRITVLSSVEGFERDVFQLLKSLESANGVESVISSLSYLNSSNQSFLFRRWIQNGIWSSTIESAAVSFLQENPQLIHGFLPLFDRFHVPPQIDPELIPVCQQEETNPMKRIQHLLWTRQVTVKQLPSFLRCILGPHKCFSASFSDTSTRHSILSHLYSLLVDFDRSWVPVLLDTLAILDNVQFTITWECFVSLVLRTEGVYTKDSTKGFESFPSVFAHMMAKVSPRDRTDWMKKLILVFKSHAFDPLGATLKGILHAMAQMGLFVEGISTDLIEIV